MQLKTLKSSLLKQPRYPFFITIVFFAVISYLTIFHNDFLKEGDFFQYFLIGKEILDGKFKSLGLIGNNVVFSCGSSVTASVLGVAYSLINNKYMPIIYVGSWSEYGKE
mgnify:CR=1 FL=1